MAGALRVVSVQRGEAPREFTLLPFGGAGGLHACALADQLQMRRILVPANPGLLSAVGLVLAGVIRDYSRSVLLPAATAGEDLAAYYRPLEERARQEMAAEGVSGQELELQPSLDIRYRGQSFEVNVAWSEDFAAAFHRRHRELYGHADPQRPLEVVTVRLRAVGRGLAPDLTRGRCTETEARAAETRPVTIKGQELSCPVFNRDELPCGGQIAGPALVVEETATHLVAPGWVGRIDARGNLLLERSGDK